MDAAVVPAGYMSVIAGISYERGKELIELHDEAVSANDFAEYIMGLHEKHYETKIAIFADNLSVHHVVEIVELCEELDIMLIFNKPYCP